MNKKRSLFLLFMLVTLTLSGCWDTNEPEKMLYVTGIGIDYKDGKYELYAQIINFANTAKSEQPPSEDTAQAEVGHASGDSLDKAIFDLYHTVDQRVNWGHLTYLIVSEDALQATKLAPVIDIFIRYRETRYQIWLYTTKDSVEEVMLVRPVVNKAIILSKLGDPRNSFEQESFIKPMNIRELLIGLNEPSHETLVPLVTIKENWKSIKESIKAPDISGAGIVSPHGFKGFITGEKARGLRWMSNDTNRSNITFQTEEGKFTSVIVQNIKVKITPLVIQGDVKFDIDIYGDAYIDIITDSIKPEKIKQSVQEKMKEEIMATYEEGLKMDSDIYRLSEHLYRKNVKEWKRLQTKGKIELTKESIRNVDIVIGKLSSNKKSFQQTID